LKTYIQSIIDRLNYIEGISAYNVSVVDDYAWITYYGDIIFSSSLENVFIFCEGIDFGLNYRSFRKSKVVKRIQENE
jgi:hypothetical protein